MILRRELAKDSAEKDANKTSRDDEEDEAN